MAIIKEIDSEYGAKANYWVIGNINASFENSEVIAVRMDGYINQEAYEQNKRKLTSKTMQVALDDDFKKLIFEAVEAEVKKSIDFK